MHHLVNFKELQSCKEHMSVTLIGAGPGDPELLTLKAVKKIAQATVILVDDLVNPEILAHASPRARIIHVGKRGGCVSTPQSFIEKLMLLGVRDGEQVVRLKGGDPFIFGRGGEEMENLRAQGIKVEVINGITSGLAAGSALGIPLTHRKQAHGVILITGHNKPGDNATDWAVLARAAARCELTLVIYMGMTNIKTLEEGLIEGLQPETPAAVVQRATLPDQAQVICTLGTLSETVRDRGIQSPAIIIVGAVVSSACIEKIISQHEHEVAA